MNRRLPLSKNPQPHTKFCQERRDCRICLISEKKNDDDDDVQEEEQEEPQTLLNSLLVAMELEVRNLMI